MNMQPASLDARSVATALGGDVVSPTKVLAPGPGHSPDDRSMSVMLDSKAPCGIRVHSFAEDDWRDCLDFTREKLGLPRWKPKPKREKQGCAQPVAEYIYRDQDGTPYLKVVRLPNRPNGKKDIRQMRWNGCDWEWGAPKEPKIPYHLAALLEYPDSPVFIVEGEKDADNVQRIGLLATTASEGAGKWMADLGHWFDGRTVYILPDNDVPGWTHACQVAKHLYGIAAEVRIVALPDLPEKGDVSNWLEAGGKAEELVALCQAAPTWTPDNKARLQGEATALTPTPHAFVWRDPATIPPRPWLYGLHLLRKQVSVTVAPSGLGKSSNAIVEALAMASGRDLLGEGFVKRLRVWIINLEDPLEELERRVTAAMIHHEIRPEEVVGYLFLSGREERLCTAVMTREGVQVIRPAVEDMEQKILALQIDVVNVDPFVSSHQVPENDNGAIDLVAKEWAAVADHCNCGVELIHHTRKLNGEEGTTESGRGANALLAAARSGRVLNRMTDKEKEEAGIKGDPATLFSALKDKTNVAPPGQRAWRRVASVDLGNGDIVGVGVVERWNWPDTSERVSVQDLLAVQRALDGKAARYSDKADDWAGHIVAETLDLDGKEDRQRIKRMIDTWVGSGALVKVNRADAKRMLRPCVEVGEWAIE